MQSASTFACASFDVRSTASPTRPWRGRLAVAAGCIAGTAATNRVGIAGAPGVCPLFGVPKTRATRRSKPARNQRRRARGTRRELVCAGGGKDAGKRESDGVFARASGRNQQIVNPVSQRCTPDQHRFLRRSRLRRPREQWRGLASGVSCSWGDVQQVCLHFRCFRRTWLCQRRVRL